MVRVLFVCMGNICRSPMAEGVFRRLAEAAGLPIETDSAGTSGHHVDQTPDPRAIETARHFEIDIAARRARKLIAADIEAFDYLVAMDRDNLAHLERLAGERHRTRLSLLLDHAKGIGLDEVPDPYYGGDEGFVRCFRLIEAGAKGLLSHIETQHFGERKKESGQ